MTTAVTDVHTEESRRVKPETSATEDPTTGFACGDCYTTFPSLAVRDLHMETQHEVKDSRGVICCDCTVTIRELNCSACRVRFSAARMCKLHRSVKHAPKKEVKWTGLQCAVGAECSTTTCKASNSCSAGPATATAVAVCCALAIKNGKRCVRGQCLKPIGGIFACGECAAFLPSRSTLDIHMRIHCDHSQNCCSSPLPYCTICKIEFLSGQSFEVHRKVAHRSATKIVETPNQQSAPPDMFSGYSRVVETEIVQSVLIQANDEKEQSLHSKSVPGEEPACLLNEIPILSEQESHFKTASEEKPECSLGSVEHYQHEPELHPKSQSADYPELISNELCSSQPQSDRIEQHLLLTYEIAEESTAIIKEEFEEPFFEMSEHDDASVSGIGHGERSLWICGISGESRK